MKPYYADDLVTLYHGDAREVLPQLTVAADMLLVDPPYGQSYKSNRGGSHDRIDGDDGTLDVPALLMQVCRLLRRGRHAYVFGPESLIGPPLTAAVQLIWDKGIVGTGDLSLPWARSHEPITFAVYEPSKANREKGYGRLSARIRQGSVLRVQRTQGAGTLRHPTEKPVELLRRLIESSSVMGETVLDCCAGVASTGVAARLEGRRAVLIEQSEAYCEVGARRLAEHAAVLFGDAA